MLSTKSAFVISTCSLGIGIFIGRRSHNLKDEYLDNKQTTFVFPMVSAKSKSYSPDSVSENKSLTVAPGSAKLTANNVVETMKYGYPSMENVRSFEDFILSYDKRNRTANWVLEHLTPEKVDKKNVDRTNMKFLEDLSFHAYHRATNKDFQGSGYDRGHLAAAANHRHSNTAMAQTFFLSNVAPQVGEGFNRDAWNNLEKYTRALARKNKNVHICTGPLYLPRVEPNGKLYVKYEVIGANHVAVPTHFFKVVLIENEKGDKDLMSFVMPNERLPDVKLSNYFVPLEMIERAAGLNFFDKLPKNSFKRVNTISNK